jgi:hypothetical protein
VAIKKLQILNINQIIKRPIAPTIITAIGEKVISIFDNII